MLFSNNRSVSHTSSGGPKHDTLRYLEVNNRFLLEKARSFQPKKLELLSMFKTFDYKKSEEPSYISKNSSFIQQTQKQPTYEKYEKQREKIYQTKIIQNQLKSSLISQLHSSFISQEKSVKKEYTSFKYDLKKPEHYLIAQTPQIQKKIDIQESLSSKKLYLLIEAMEEMSPQQFDALSQSYKRQLVEFAHSVQKLKNIQSL